MTKQNDINLAQVAQTNPIPSKCEPNQCDSHTPSAVEIDSTITTHLIMSPSCLNAVCKNVPEHFKIHTRVRSKCHRDVLEAVYIAKLQPELCRQKEFVRKLVLS